MNNKIKTCVFKVIDVLPNRLGYYVYHKLQEVSSKLTINDKLKSTENSYSVIVRILNNCGIQVEGKTVVEIGSGWAPILPYLFVYQSKVDKVITYDVNKHYTTKSIEQLNQIFSDKFNHELSKNNFKLHKKVIYFPFTNIANTKLPDVDLIVSRFVLEHVSPSDIKEMHNSFARNLKTNSFILHMISPSDHRAYADKNLSLYDFLKYSQEEWDKIQTKFDYHNRLRLPQYLELFKQNFEIIYLEYSSCNIGSFEHEKYNKVKVHEFFKNWSFEELTAGSINVLLKKI